MKKKTIAQRMAEKAFQSPNGQQSWNVHMQAFGPILEPAFADDIQSRLHLCAALNLISQRKLPQGLKKLQSLHDKCVSDADKAAVLFFTGVACEMAGEPDQMFVLYTYANEFGHKFYMPYIKCAKYSINCGDYLAAERDFLAAIACFDGKGLGEQDKLILGSAYTNLATCYTMTRRFGEAEAALATSRQLCPNADGRPSAEAILYAAQGKGEECGAALSKLSGEALEYTREVTDKLLAGEDPRFVVKEVPGERIAAFWDWFAVEADALARALEGEDKQPAVHAISQRLGALFDFLENDPEIGIGYEDGVYTVELMDFCHASLEAGYGKLLTARPGGQENWKFTIIH